MSAVATRFVWSWLSALTFSYYPLRPLDTRNKYLREQSALLNISLLSNIASANNEHAYHHKSRKTMRGSSLENHNPTVELAHLREKFLSDLTKRVRCMTKVRYSGRVTSEISSFSPTRACHVALVARVTRIRRIGRKMHHKERQWKKKWGERVDIRGRQREIVCCRASLSLYIIGHWQRRSLLRIASVHPLVRICVRPFTTFLRAASRECRLL